MNFPKSSLIPRQDCIFLGELILDGVLHLLSINGQMEVTIDTLVSRQECGLTLCKAVDEAYRHTNIYRLPGALGQTASETDTA